MSPKTHEFIITIREGRAAAFIPVGGPPDPVESFL